MVTSSCVCFSDTRIAGSISLTVPTHKELKGFVMDVLEEETSGHEKARVLLNKFLLLVSDSLLRIDAFDAGLVGEFHETFAT